MNAEDLGVGPTFIPHYVTDCKFKTGQVEASCEEEMLADSSSLSASGFSSDHEALTWRKVRFGVRAVTWQLFKA